MPKLIGSDEIVKLLKAHGFELISQRGSHQKYRKGNGQTVIVPAGRKVIPRGTTRSIIRQSGLSREIFE